MTASNTTPETRAAIIRRLLQVAGTALAFAALNYLGYLFQVQNGVSVFFPATAVDVVACMVFGWWGALGIFLGALATPWQPNELLWQTSVSGLLNVAEGMIPYAVFRLRPSLRNDLSDFRSLFAFLLFGTVLNSAFSALAGNFLLIPHANGGIGGRELFMWWVSDFSAALILGMPILAFGADILRKWSGRERERRTRTLANALQITVAIIFLGWTASTLIQNFLAEQIENERVEQQRASMRIAREMTELHRTINALARGEESGAGRSALTANAEAHLAAIASLSPMLKGETVGDLNLLVASTHAWMSAGSPIAQGARIAETLLRVRAGLEERENIVWQEFSRRRARIRLVSLLMDQIVLIVLVLASAHVVFKMSRPLRQMHSAVASLRDDSTPVGEKVDSDFVELQVLAHTIDDTSQALKQYAENLRLQTENALAASRAKSDFLAKMSHELRTPLNSIVGFSNLLLERGENVTAEKRESFLHNVVRSGNHLLGLINDLLDLAKVEAGKMKFNFEIVDARFVVHETVAAIHPIFEQRMQKVDVKMPDSPVPVYADRVRLGQVLVNLLSNANKFSPEGSVVTVELAAGDDCCIKVVDRGIGIGEEDQRRIFDDFEQLATNGARRGGTGLGLGLVKRLMEAHAGTVAVHSEVGRGSTFTVRLPIVRDSNFRNGSARVAGAVPSAVEGTPPR